MLKGVLERVPAVRSPHTMGGRWEGEKGQEHFGHARFHTTSTPLPHHRPLSGAGAVAAAAPALRGRRVGGVCAPEGEPLDMVLTHLTSSFWGKASAAYVHQSVCALSPGMVLTHLTREHSGHNLEVMAAGGWSHRLSGSHAEAMRKPCENNETPRATGSPLGGRPFDACVDFVVDFIVDFLHVDDSRFSG